MSIKVTVWGEYRHEKRNPEVAKIYPEGMHEQIARFLREGDPNFQVRTAWLDQDQNGLTEDILNDTDVLTWWGHMAHADVQDLIVEKVYQRVLAGMGIVVLHSGHFSKIFKKLMGTTCNLKWRAEGERETLWVTRPGHPIVEGIGEGFVLETEEMYGEFFDIPEPMETLMISSFAGGEVFRSACTFTRGAGRIFYFRPGHETFPTYFDKNVQRVICNGVKWVARPVPVPTITFGRREPGWLTAAKEQS